jgi:hypothetical protein
MRTLTVLLAAAGSLLGVVTAAPAFAAGGPLAAGDKLLCSPASNGGHLVHGVCVLPGAHVAIQQEYFIITKNESGGIFQVSAGALPPGLLMPSSYGAAGTIIGGSPTQEGTFAFTVTGTDGAGQALRQAYRITVGAPLPLAIWTPGTLAAGQAGVAYSPLWFLIRHDAPAPITYSVIAGHLPPGLSLSSPVAPTIIDNQLSGTPAKAGTYRFTMRVTDGFGRQATKGFSLTIGS